MKVLALALTLTSVSLYAQTRQTSASGTATIPNTNAESGGMVTPSATAPIEMTDGQAREQQRMEEDSLRTGTGSRGTQDSSMDEDETRSKKNW